MYTLKRATVFVFMFCLASVVSAQELSSDDTQSLDGQVQEIKADVLEIAAELGNLEERLLYPSGSQVSVFVEIDADDEFRLDAVKLEIDGELAAHHIYSFKELDALRKGGVQRLFTGNTPSGDHELRVTVIGKHKSGKDFTESDSFVFSKNVEPKTLGITLAGPGFTGSGIQIGNW